MKLADIRRALRRLPNPPAATRPPSPLFDMSYEELVAGAEASLEKEYGKPVDQITEQDLQRKREAYVRCHDCGGAGCKYCDWLGQVRIP